MSKLNLDLQKGFHQVGDFTKLAIFRQFFFHQIELTFAIYDLANSWCEVSWIIMIVADAQVVNKHQAINNKDVHEASTEGGLALVYSSNHSSGLRSLLPQHYI